MRWARVGAVVLALVLLSCVVHAPLAASASATSADSAPTLVLLDTSGSMDEMTGYNKVRIDAARGAVMTTIAALSSSDHFGLVSYPGGGGSDKSGCSVGKVVTPLGPLSHRAATAQVRGLRPNGQTPTAPAMKHAAQLIADAGWKQATIILVSDGESNCGGDPCEVAAELKPRGVEVRFITVGFEVGEAGAEQLKCIADVTGGKYFTAQNEDELARAIAAGSGGSLTVDASVPDRIPVVSGAPTHLGTPIPVTVANTGLRTAKDVRVSMQVGELGQVLVLKPVRFLGNLAPGESRELQFTVRPDAQGLNDPLRWTVAATSLNSTPGRDSGTAELDYSIGREDLGPLLATAERVAVLGDSYSSGEGAGNYTESSSGSAANWCHRSDWAYAPVIFGESRTHTIACSGAVTRDLTSQQLSHDQLMVPQVLKLRAEAVSPSSPEAVLVTIGGNDIGFGEIVKGCALRAGCQNDYFRPEGSALSVKFGEYFIERARVVSADLVRSYHGIDAALNDKAAVEARGGKVAPIVVLPYVRIVPETWSDAKAPGGCFLGFSGDEVAWMNTLIDQLNQSIRWSVEQLQARSRPVYYASEVVGAFQPNHTACEQTESFANFVSLNGITRLGDLSVIDEELRQELAHPNSDGYEAIARAVATWSRNVAPTTSGPAPTYTSEIQYADHGLVAFGNWLTGTDAPGTRINVTVDGFGESTAVVFTLQSVERTLGTANVGQDGKATISTVIPNDVPIGDHHVVAVGLDEKGKFRRVSTAVTLQRPGFGASTFLAAVGAVCTLGGAAVLGISRSRAVRASQ